MSVTAKSVVLDIADNWGSTDVIGIRQVEFYNGASLISLTVTTDFVAYATSYYSGTDPQYAFDTATSKSSGSPFYNEWGADSGNITNQRLICVFNSPQTFTGIVVNNGFKTGDYIRGAQNVKIQISDDAITDTTYNAAVANSSIIYNSTFDQHVASDTEDAQTLVLIQPDVVTAEPFEAVGSLSATVTPTLRTMTSVPFELVASMSGAPGVSYEFVTSEPFEATSSLSATVLQIAAVTAVPFGLTASLSATQRDSLVESLDMELPMLEFLAYGPSGIEFEIPALSLDITGTTGKIANIKAAIPMLSMEATSGVYISAELPSMSMQIDSVSQTLAQMAASLPMFTMQIDDVGNRFGDITASIPMLHMAASSIHGAVVSLSSNLPMLYIDIDALAGTVGDMGMSIPMFQTIISGAPNDTIDASIPILTMAISAQQNINIFDLILPSLMASINTTEVSDGALRYVRGTVR